MGRYILVAQGQGVPGKEEAFLSWYDNTHLPEVCAVPGIVSARRFAAPEGGRLPPPIPNMIIYEVETDDMPGVLRELNRRAKTGEIERFDGVDLSTASLWFYELSYDYHPAPVAADERSPA